MQALIKFLRWWRAELRQLVSGPLRWLRIEHDEPRIIKIKKSYIEILQRKAGRLETVQTVDIPVADRSSNSQNVTSPTNRKIYVAGLVTIPNERILRKHLALPKEAKKNIRTVLAYQLNKVTPFQTNDVYFDYRVVSHDDRAGQLHVELAMVDRKFIDHSFAIARKAGIDSRGAVMFGEEDKSEIIFRFAGNAGASDRSRPLDFAIGTLSITAILLVCTAGYLPFYIQQRELAQAQTLLDAAHRLAKESSQIEASIKKLLTRRNFTADKKRTTVPLVVQLNNLTRRIPDGTWLTQFTAKGQGIHLWGITPSFEKLLILLENSEQFSDVTLNAKVIRDEKTGLERFQASMHVIEANP